MENFVGTKKADDDDLSGSDDDSVDGETEVPYEDEDCFEEPDDEYSRQPSNSKVGMQLVGLWARRSVAMRHKISIAAWMLSPVPEICAHVKQHLKADDKAIVSALVVKLFMPRGLTEQEQMNWKQPQLNVFWSEYEEFDTRTGVVFGEASGHIWSSSDITNNRSHFWHKKYTYVETKLLGRVACRVCSKICGIGSAERSWGAVKFLKQGQRSHLSAEAAAMQATVFGAASARQAEIEQAFKPGKDIVVWEDADLDSLGLTRYGLDKQNIQSAVPASQQRVYNCWTEP
jgi:hypothetical protein